MQATGTQTLPQGTSPRRVLVAALLAVAIVATLAWFAITRMDASAPSQPTVVQVSVEPGHHQPATLIHRISMRPVNGN
jgi:hypothetical protein